MKAFIEKLTKANMRAMFIAAWKHAEAAMEEGGVFEIVVRKKIKSRDQEEHYHALIGDIADQYVHQGRKWDAEDMKRLMVDAFKYETKTDPDLRELWDRVGDMRLVPAIGRDGFVALGEQTRKFPVALAAAFITWLYAFGNENGVRWTNPKLIAELKQYEAMPEARRAA